MLMVFMCHSLRDFCASSKSSCRGSISAFSSSTRCIACAYCLTACLRSGWCALMIWAGSYGLLAFWMSSAFGSIPASFSQYSLSSIHSDCFRSSRWAVCHRLKASIALVAVSPLCCWVIIFLAAASLASFCCWTASLSMGDLPVY